MQLTEVVESTAELIEREVPIVFEAQLAAFERRATTRSSSSGCGARATCDQRGLSSARRGKCYSKSRMTLR